MRFDERNCKLQGGAELVRFYINVLEATVTVNLKVLYDAQTASMVRRHNQVIATSNLTVPIAIHLGPIQSSSRSSQEWAAGTDRICGADFILMTDKEAVHRGISSRCTAAMYSRSTVDGDTSSCLELSEIRPSVKGPCS